MRPSFVLPSACAAVVLLTAGAMWADTARRHTVTGRPAAIGATGALTTGPQPPSSPAPGPSTPSRSTKHTTKPTPKPTRTAAQGGAGRQAAVPYQAPTSHKAAAHGSCRGASASGASSTEAAVFALLNQERAANGLCPMQWSSLLQKSARQHSTLMDQKSTAADCSDGNYSHRYSGEPDIDTRIFATGYPHGPVAEAIGCSPDTSTNGALTLQRLMYNEKPPANQHREMILSSIVDHVGIAIVVDSRDGTLWLTEDYGS
jgi:uncharacterized protein YkwD